MIPALKTKNPHSDIRLVSREQFNGEAVAREFLAAARERLDDGAPVLWGLPLGPIDLYAPLVDIFREEKPDLSRVRTFNLDEYLDPHGQWVPMDKWYSFRGIMEKELFGPLHEMDSARAIQPENVHFPDPENLGLYPKRIAEHGGLDICYLGMGLNGHIAFNEPPETEEEISVDAFGAQETRVVRISPKTIVQNFSGRRAQPFIPSRAVTMGMREILGARKILMRTSSWDGLDILERALLGPITPIVPASFLQLHPDCTFILPDEDLANVQA